MSTCEALEVIGAPDMSEQIAFGMNIHAAPKRAEVYGNEDCVSLHFTGDLYPYTAIYCGSPALAFDLAAAINAVLARHRDLAGANGRPEGGA